MFNSKTTVSEQIYVKYKYVQNQKKLSPLFRTVRSLGQIAKLGVFCKHRRFVHANLLTFTVEFKDVNVRYTDMTCITARGQPGSVYRTLTSLTVKATFLQIADKSDNSLSPGKTKAQQNIYITFTLQLDLLNGLQSSLSDIRHYTND